MHEDPQMLNLISNQLSRVTDSFDLFEGFKVELKNVLNLIIGGHNAVKQELFLIRNDQANGESKLKDIDISVKNLTELVISGSSPSSSNYKANASRSGSSRPTPPTAPTPKVPPPGTFKAATPAPAPRTSKVFEKPSSASSMPPTQPKILFIGDSISAHADIEILAEATNSKIVTAKAYSAVHDDVSNVAKQAAFYPNKNFLQVVPAEAGKDNFEHLIIQTGSVDITNLKTNKNANQYLEYFKQETIKSAKNIFNSGVCALERQPSLKSVIFLKQTPRYDPIDVDPLSIKPALSQLFNNTMMELWIHSPMKEQIFVGSHNIDCSGAIQSARYRHTKTGRFDGVHLYGSSGSKAYTLSMLNILRSASLISSEDDYHLSCAQYEYQHRQYRHQVKC